MKNFDLTQYRITDEQVVKEAIKRAEDVAGVSIFAIFAAMEIDEYGHRSFELARSDDDTTEFVFSQCSCHPDVVQVFQIPADVRAAIAVSRAPMKN